MLVLEPPVLEDLAIDACRAAVDHIRQHADRTVLAIKSGHTDIVTSTDIAAEAAIRSVLARRTPGSTVLGEEGGRRPTGDGPHGAIEWIVDPIDGTVNFAYGIPVTAVSVAAVVGGVPTAGAVVDVERNETFSAHLGGGARGSGMALHTTGCDELLLALIATGYPYDRRRRELHGRAIGELVGRVRDVRCVGSAALNLCWLAAGRVDAYVERDIKPWDHAAGALIALEAGAAVELPCVENDHLVLAANPTLFEALREHF